jgi:hypothetical protein
MKNGGWLDNYNDSQASAPEGMIGDGYSNKGRNYSPAWGGSFQMGGSVYPVNYVPQAAMGGSIPGAVGFSYARTQGAAPSNGKYAKKTMASAQNGQEMQYYQNGLDWQPKSISKNGGWLDQYEDGGIVKGDQDGYRNPNNRGKVVEIQGSVMGTDGYDDTLYVVPDVGEPRVVYANTGNHEFPGATKFTEYPMAQNGLRQEQKSLQNLDNLTNFTNYNKPQPGSWLEKYN